MKEHLTTNFSIIMIIMYKRIAIQNLIKVGWQKKDIAEEMGCHRNTVININKEKKQ